MIRQTKKLRSLRRGAILVLAAVMVAVLLGIVAFAVDYGHLLKVRTDLQRTADASALAAVQDLIRKADGTQDVNAARETARTYARDNVNNASFQLPESDILIGRYDPDSIYSNVTLLNDGTFDAVRVTARRDGAANPEVPLFFARILGMDEAPVTARATAILQKASVMGPGADVLPFATPKFLWDSLSAGDQWTLYGDGQITDGDGNSVPGNWGTVDIGSTNNSTSEMNDQILNGLGQDDLNALQSDGRIPDSSYIDSTQPIWLQGEPGLSAGLKQSVEAVHGTKKVIPIFDQLGGGGGNTSEFHIVGWGVVTVIDSHWHGTTNVDVTVRKSHALMGELRAIGDLGAESGYIDGAYTSPVIVE
ncbi:MAG TPA: pilus assembly protein TadG-related protein [Lacipirellulaceae bacterium]